MEADVFLSRWRAHSIQFIIYLQWLMRRCLGPVPTNNKPNAYSREYTSQSLLHRATERAEMVSVLAPAVGAMNAVSSFPQIPDLRQGGHRGAFIESW